MHINIYYCSCVQIASALWWYYFSKFIEFFDTVSLVCIHCTVGLCQTFIIALVSIAYY